jgi:heptosyltransferase II
MTGYDASVLNSPDTRLLIVVPNWLGDGIMAMPAVQVLRSRLHAEAKIAVAARPGQTGLWEMQSAISQVIPLPAGNRQLPASARRLKQTAFTHAVILPHSFRSALLCRLAGIPRRRGTIDQCGRTWLIQDPVSLEDQARRHQQWEIAKLLLPDPLPERLPTPRIQPPEAARTQAAALLASLPRPILGCIPGAARGPSKQWPGDRFKAVATAWIKQTGGGVCWLGTPGDAALCESLNQDLNEAGINLAGKSDLKTFTALLQSIDHTLVNDSGGMHLAAAVGTPLVAVFGNTDPEKTGPLSANAVVIQHSETKNRSIGRESPDAEAALARVGVEEVGEAVLANYLPNL